MKAEQLQRRHDPEGFCEYTNEQYIEMKVHAESVEEKNRILARDLKKILMDYTMHLRLDSTVEMMISRDEVYVDEFLEPYVNER